MLEQAVYDYLVEYHYGKENLIKNQDLRAKFGINSDKAMRNIIQKIRQSKDFKLGVGSISGNSGGFYICACREDVEDTIKNIRHRTAEMNKTADIMEEKLDGYPV